MTTEFRDIRPDLEQRLETLRRRLRELHAQRAELEHLIRDVGQQLRTLEAVWRMEMERIGEGDVSPAGFRDGRLLTLPLGEAVALLRRENPDITKEEVRERLLQAGYDFRGRRVGNAVHAAWLAFEGKESPTKAKAGRGEPAS
ncbi:MAG: hypothetical protein ACE5IG_07045 [Dehalococcoidia bacterium]